MKYITRIPPTIPEGKIVVHNHVVPYWPIGMNGFRVWLDDPSEKYERCSCEWRGLKSYGGVEHYRVKPELLGRSEPKP